MLRRVRFSAHFDRLHASLTLGLLSPAALALALGLLLLPLQLLWPPLQSEPKAKAERRRAVRHCWCSCCCWLPLLLPLLPPLPPPPPPPPPRKSRTR